MSQPKELYYKVVRFKTGENILCQMRKDVRSLAQESYLRLIRPVIGVPIGYVNNKETKDVYAEHIAFRPWLSVADTEEYVIALDLVLTVGDMRPSLIANYEQYWKSHGEVAKVLENREFQKYATESVNEFLLSMSSNGEVTIIQEDDET